MAYVKPAHQYAGDGRVPFSHGGNGEGRVTIQSTWSASELTLDASQKIWKALKNCYVSNFAIRVTDMDTHATPTLEWNVGSAATGAQFISGNTTSWGETGGYSVTNAVDESTVAGTYLAADAYIYLNVEEAAATGAAGTVTVSFDVAYL